jgi:hypothetical protein
LDFVDVTYAADFALDTNRTPAQKHHLTDSLYYSCAHQHVKQPHIPFNAKLHRLFPRGFSRTAALKVYIKRARSDKELREK